MKRAIGLMLAVAAALSLIVSLAGLIGVWSLRQPIGDQISAAVDLISKRKQDIQDLRQDITFAVRFIEVKGRAGIGEVALSSNEYKVASCRNWRSVMSGQ